MANNRIDYTIGFKTDMTGLNQIKSSLQQIKQMTASDLMRIGGHQDIKKAEAELGSLKNSIRQIEGALDKAFNTNLGTLNVSKFNQELKKMNLKKVQQDFANAGAAGQTAFRNLTSQILTTNMKLKETHSMLNKMGETMGNTLKWGVASAAMNKMTTSVREAWSFTKRLDTSLNDIRIVTGKSAEEMSKFADQANKAAKKLGQTTTNYTDASLIYYQQGLGDQEAAARAETTLKAANVTGQTGEEVSEQLTSVWNGYKVSAEETELYIDKLAAVAATTASNLEELSTGMSKVASAASSSGVNIDQLNATLSTVISATRQAPETIGTAFKTIYARLGDLAVDGEDEFGTSLGEVSSKLKTMGIDIIDSEGNMREMGTVVEEVAAKWETWTDAQQQAAAVAMAGKRQYNNLIALFENWDKYESALSTSADAAGTLQKQQDIYMESTAAHLKVLKASAEDLYNSLLDPKGINVLIDGLTLAVQGMATFADAAGGGAGVLLLLGSTAMQVFNKQIASSLTTTIINFRNAKENAAQLNAEMQILNQFKGIDLQNAQTQKLVEMKRQQLAVSQALTNEERNLSNEYIKQQNELFKEQDALNNRKIAIQESYKTATGETLSLNNKNSFNKNDVASDFTDRAKEIEGNSKAATKKNLTTAYNQLTKAAEKYVAIGNLEESQDNKVKEATENLRNTVEKHNGTVMKALSNAEKLLADTNFEKEAKTQLAAEIEKLNALRNKDGVLNLKNKEVIAQLAKVEEARVGVYKKQGQLFRQRAADIKNLEAEEERLKNKTSQLQATWNSFIQTLNLKVTVQHFTNLVSKVGQFVSGVTSLSQIPSIFNDENLSIGEKTLRITTSLTMGLPMLITGIMGTKTAYDAMSASIAESILMSQLKSNSQLQEIGIESVHNTQQALALILQRAGIELTEKEIAELTVENSLRILNNALIEGHISATSRDTAATLINTVAEEKQRVAILKTIGAKTAKIALMAGPYLVAAAAVTAAVYAIVKAENANEAALESATESMKRQGEILTRLQEEHKTLQEQIEGYEDAYFQIQKLTEGTEEYATAIEESNEKARDLIETLDLFGQYSYDTNGAIQLDEDAVQEAYDQKSQDVNQADVRYQSAQYKTNQARWEVIKENDAFDTYSVNDIDRLFADSNDINDNKEFNMTQLSSISDDAYIEIKDLSELTKGTKDYEDRLNSITEKFGISSTIIESLSEVIKDLGNTADATRNEIKGLIEEEDYRLEQIAKSNAESQGLFGNDDLAQTAYANLLSQDEDFKATAQKNAVLTNQNVDNSDFSGLLEQQEGGKTWGYFGINDEELSKYYAKYVEGWSDDEIKKAKYESGWGKGTLTRADGTTFTMDDEEMRKELYGALLANNLSKGKDKDGNAAYDDKAIKEIVSNVMDSGFQQTTQDAVLTAMSNYNSESGKLDLDLSLIHPDDVEGLLTQAEEMGNGIGNKIVESLKNYDSEDYYDRMEEDHEKNIDAQIQAEGLDAGAIETQTKLIQANTESLKDNENAAKQLAVNNTLMNQGMADLIENWEDWEDVLNSGDKTTSDYAKTVKEVSKCLEDLVGLGEGMGENLSAAFFDSAENLELLEKAANADVDAVEQLGYAVAEDLVQNMEFDSAGWTESIDVANAEAAELGEVWEGIEFSNGFADSVEEIQSNFEGAKTAVLNGINQIKAAEMGVGDTLANSLGAEKTTEFVNGLNDMAMATQMSVTEMQGMLNSLGLQATVTTTSVPTVHSVPRMRTEEEIINNGEDGNPIIKETKTWQVGTDKEKGTIDVAQIAYDGKNPSSLPITKINSGGATSANKSAASSGGGGGSTPSRSTKSSGAKKDRYRKVNNELSKLENQLDKLANAQERAYGKGLLDNLNEQLDVIKNQVKWSQKKLNIARAEAKEMRTKRIANYKDENGYEVKNDLQDFGIEFDDKTKEITNYNAKMQWYDDKIAELEEQWNNMSASEQEDNESLGNRIDALTENRETLQTLVEEYDELIYETIPGLENEIAEAAYQQIEIEIQAFKVEGQLYLDMSEALEQLKDFKQQMNEYLTYDELDIGYTDDGKDLALGGGSLLSEASISEKDVNANLDMLLGTENKDGTRTGLGLMGTIGDGTDSPVSVLTGELKGLQSEYEKYRQDPDSYRGKFAKEGEDGKWYFDEAGFREAMQETSENLEEEIAKVEEAYKENREALLNSIDLIGESYDQQMETYDFINDRIESQIEAAKLLNGETDYAGMQSYYEQASANAQAKADTAKEEMDLAYSKMNDPELSAEEREKWKKIYEESVAEYEDASFAAIEAYKAENENYVKMQADAAFGTDAELDLADAQWDVQTKLDDKYLDDIDKAYETQKLSRKLQQDMDGASLAAQQKLAKFRDEELEKLKKKDKLTQYDVDRANKLYEIELKKIALEEAQQNKSKMRLRRDSSGNYSYQFVADEDQTAEAQQGLEDAQYGLREMDLEHQRELQEKMLEMQKEYKEKWIEYQLLSEEEQKLREDEYKIYFQYYQDELTNMSAQALDTQDNLKNSSFETAKTLYNQDKTNFKDLTDAQKRALEDKNKRFTELTTAEKNAITGEGGLMPTWNAAILDMAAKFGGEGEDTFESKIKKAQGNVSVKQDELNGKITAAATGIQTAAQTAQTQAQNKWLPAQKKVNTQLKTMNTRLSNANKYLKKQKEWWKKIKDEAQKAIEKTQTYLALTSKEEAGKTKNNKNNTGKNNTGTNTGKGTQGNGKVNKGDKVKLIGKLAESSYESPTLEPLSKYKGAQLYVQSINSGSKAPYHLGTSPDFDDEDTWVGWVNKAQISGYDTGGYTGSGWAPQDKNQGKLAFLHEKELILNSTDTQNILDLVYLLRKMNIEKDLSSMTISGTGVQNAMSANALEYSNRMVNALVTGIDNIIQTISFAKQDSQKLEQNVHITAEFPDVKEAEEIKLALNNLTNRASQYISNSRRR